MPGGILPVVGAIQRSFGGGELAPALYARADDVRYATGLRTCRNFLIHRAGGVSNRPGTRFIAPCKTASQTVQLIPYLSELPAESVLIECGVFYLRFFFGGAAVRIDPPPAWDGGTTYVIGDLVSDAGVHYYAVRPSLAQAPPSATFWYPMPEDSLELPTPFAALPYWSQRGRVITLTHEDTPPHELIYESLTRWTIAPVVTVPQIDPPSGVTLVPGVAGTLTYGYVVTAAGPDYEESIASAQVINATCGVPTQAAPHVVSWTPIPGAPEYYVYADIFANGTYGYIGTATGESATFHDVGFEPDFTITPPVPTPLFDAVDQYPKVSASYQQRRFFGYTKARPDVIHASRVGYPSNFTISSPLQDDDALEFQLAGHHHHPVRHLFGVGRLVVLSDAGEWIVTGGADAVLTPSSLHAEQETYAGAAAVKPVVIGNRLIYVQARGSVPRDLQFDLQIEGLAGRDLTIFSSHLFEGYTLRRLDYALVPHSIVWAVRSDGALLGMTYLPELDVWGWHRHDTVGFFWDVCVLPEETEDGVYVIVRRTINGETVRYIERFANRYWTPTFTDDAFFVDSGLTYVGAPINNVTGLAHLEGADVVVVGDGAVVARAARVTGGTLADDLPDSYSTIHVGLAYVAELETLDLDVGGAAVRDRQKATGPVQLLIDRSSRTFLAGPDAAQLRPYAPPTWEPAADEFTGQVEIHTTKTFTRYGRVLVRQADPLPLTVLGIIPNVELGG